MLRTVVSAVGLYSRYLEESRFSGKATFFASMPMGVGRSGEGTNGNQNTVTGGGLLGGDFNFKSSLVVETANRPPFVVFPLKVARSEPRNQGIMSKNIF